MKHGCGSYVHDLDSEPHLLRFATYNIRAGIGMDGNYSLSRILSTLEECSADIIALQEVDLAWSERSLFEDQVAKMAASLKMDGFFAPIYSLAPLKSSGQQRQYGLALLSKYPYLSKTNHYMTRLSTQTANPEPALAPGFLDALIDVKGLGMRILNVQLDYRSDPSVRVKQVDEILALPDTVTTILTGDFNALPGATELIPLEAKYTDVWNIQGQASGDTYPADSPTKRIDRIFCSAGVDVLRTWVPQSLASDHRPVLADLLLPEG